jgi:hypothetical protein
VIGVDNTIYRCNLDELHSILGGLCKDCNKWCLRIGYEISLNDIHFKDAFTLFNSLICGFQNVPTVPHVEWTHFCKGLAYLVENESTKVRKGDGGSGGGYKTSFNLPALIQIYFVIVCNPGKFFPNVKSYKFVKKRVKNKTTKKDDQFSVKVGNVELIVLTAIRDILNYYFTVKREEVPYNDTSFRNSYLRMIASLDKLWHLKETIMLNFDGAIQSRSRKKHEGEHFEYSMGSCSAFSTTPYESSHRFLTVRAWDTTSGRLNSRDKEMLEYQLSRIYLSHYQTYRKVLMLRKEAFNDRLPEYGNATAHNVKNLVFKLMKPPANHLPPSLVFTDEDLGIDDIISKGVHLHHKLTAPKFFQMICRNEELLKHLLCTDLRHRLVQKVSHSDKHWGVGMYKVGSFVTVSCESEDDSPIRKDLVARIMFIIETARKITSPHAGDHHEVIEYYVGLRYLTPVTGKLTEAQTKRRKQTEFFERLKYGSHHSRTGRRGVEWEVESIDAINGDAFVIIDNDESQQGSYFYVPRQYFDRSGWEYYDDSDRTSSSFIGDDDEEFYIEKVNEVDIDTYFTRNDQNDPDVESTDEEEDEINSRP